MSGKGDKRRPSKPGAFERGYDAIDWSKGRRTPPRAKRENPDVVSPPAEAEDLLGFLTKVNSMTGHIR